MNRTRTSGQQLDWLRRPGTRRFSKYALGSVVAFGASNVVFLLVYGLGWASPQVATVLSFGIGIPVNYALNRRWAWERRGRPSVRTELVPYATVIATNVVAAAAGTWAVDRWLQSIALPRAVEVLVVGATFVLINGGLFLAKYVLLDRLVFRDRPAVAGVEPADRAVQRVP
jgi:putative flippase GtrA